MAREANPAGRGSPGGALVVQAVLMMLWPALVMAGILNAGPNVPRLSRMAAVLGWSVVCMMLIALGTLGVRLGWRFPGSTTVPV